jgi:hypothetical protein
MGNNEGRVPSMEQCAASIAKLAEHMELLEPVILRPFVERVMRRVEQRRKGLTIEDRRLDLESAGILKNLRKALCDECNDGITAATRFARYYDRNYWLCDNHAEEFALHYGTGNKDKAGNRRAAEREALGYSSDEDRAGEVMMINQVSANEQAIQESI